MERRTLGRTGLTVSVLGYGAGAVGGLMVRGTPAEQERSVGRALEAGITYFDTAPAYGDGTSERNLGRALRALGADPVLGTKVRLSPADRADIAGAVAASLEASLGRLGRDSVHLFQLHNTITAAGEGNTLRPDQVLNQVLPAFQRLRDAGKCRFIGITAVGEASALYQVVRSGAFDTAQIPYNLLNPSALSALPPGCPGEDFQGLMAEAARQGMGVIGIRILAAGALSGETARHPVAMQQVAPIATAADYATDLANARRLMPLVAEGHVASLAEAAIRFAVTPPEMSTALIGTASLAQLETAIAAAEKGSLAGEILARIAALQSR